MAFVVRENTVKRKVPGRGTPRNAAVMPLTVADRPASTRIALLQTAQVPGARNSVRCAAVTPAASTTTISLRSMRTPTPAVSLYVTLQVSGAPGAGARSGFGLIETDDGGGGRRRAAAASGGDEGEQHQKASGTHRSPPVVRGLRLLPATVYRSRGAKPPAINTV
jgi:hypothetical protein